MDVAAIRFFVMAVAGWCADQRQETVAYLIEENRILRAHPRGRIRLTDEERRRLAVDGHRLGRRRLRHVATIVTPDQKWSRDVRRRVSDAKIHVVQTPLRAPNAKDYASYCTSLG